MDSEAPASKCQFYRLSDEGRDPIKCCNDAWTTDPEDHEPICYECLRLFMMDAHEFLTRKSMKVIKYNEV